MRQELESSHCFQSLFTNPKIRWSQDIINLDDHEKVDVTRLR